jgi:glycosyltransferase involved in cell wall biosynthesis
LSSFLGTSSTADGNEGSIGDRSSSDRVPTTEVLARIRDVVEQRRTRGDDTLEPQAISPLDPAQVESLELYPWRRIVGTRTPINVADLVLAPSERFVDRCYMLLLHRHAQPAEALEFSSWALKKWRRLAFIYRIRWSAEGRRAAIPLSGWTRMLLPPPTATHLDAVRRWMKARRNSRKDGESSRSLPDSDYTQETSPSDAVAHAPAPGSLLSARRPLLSVCVTTYNRARWLAHSLPLILRQTAPYRDMVEVLVCDNASQDDTAAIATKFRHHSHFTYHRNRENIGMLRNLGASCDQARGHYVWVIGDDDLMVEGTIERVLGAITKHPETELVYTNYAYTRFDRPEELADVTHVVRGSRAISGEIRDEFAGRVSSIATKSENCFTAIYCLVYRADHALRAYHQDVAGRPFSSLSTCVPTADYVCRELFDRPGYWIGDPCVVVNMNVSWLRYASIYILERFPELFDLMEEKGVEAGRMDALRAKHVGNLPGWFRAIYLGSQRDNLSLFSAERLVRRFGHLPAFQSSWPQLRKVYRQAFRRGLVEDPSLTPDRLEAILREASRERRRRTG